MPAWRSALRSTRATSSPSVEEREHVVAVHPLGGRARRSRCGSGSRRAPRCGRAPTRASRTATAARRPAPSAGSTASGWRNAGCRQPSTSTGRSAPSATSSASRRRATHDVEAVVVGEVAGRADAVAAGGPQEERLLGVVVGRASARRARRPGTPGRAARSGARRSRGLRTADTSPRQNSHSTAFLAGVQFHMFPGCGLARLMASPRCSSSAERAPGPARATASRICCGELRVRCAGSCRRPFHCVVVAPSASAAAGGARRGGARPRGPSTRTPRRCPTASRPGRPGGYGPEPGEERQLVGAGEHVDRVDLDEPDPVAAPGGSGGGRPVPSGPGVGEALGVQRDAAGLVEAQGVGGQGHRTRAE